MTTPTIGDAIIVCNFLSNGVNQQCGVITRIWRWADDTASGFINAMAFPDAASPVAVTSIDLFIDEVSAAEHLKQQGSYGLTKRVCFFKPKV